MGVNGWVGGWGAGAGGGEGGRGKGKGEGRGVGFSCNYLNQHTKTNKKSFTVHRGGKYSFKNCTKKKKKL